MDALAASEFQKLVADAIALHKAGRLDAAERSYRAALRITPGHGAITHNLGVLAAAQGKHADAIGHFDVAIAAEPRYASAHYNRAAALEASGRTREAIAGYSRACAIEPEHYGSHRALDHFARTYELRRGEDRSGIAAASLTTANRGKLLHDADQFRYLAPRRRDGQRFELMGRAYEQAAAGAPAEAAPLSPAQLELLGEDYNTAIHIHSAPEIADGAVSARPDRDALIARYREGPSGAITFDDLLTPRALTAPSAISGALWMWMAVL